MSRGSPRHPAGSPAHSAQAQSLKTDDAVVSDSGNCYSPGEFYSVPWPVVRQSNDITLAPGKYRPVLDGTLWRFSKTKEFHDWGNYYFGEVVIDVIRVDFGA